MFHSWRVFFFFDLTSVSRRPATIEPFGVEDAVSIGAADVGVATRDAAIGFDLGFMPLAEECYDLAIPVAGLEDTRIQRLLDVMTSAEFRRELTSLGYDVRSCGERVAEISAA